MKYEKSHVREETFCDITLTRQALFAGSYILPPNQIWRKIEVNQSRSTKLRCLWKGKGRLRRPYFVLLCIYGCMKGTSTTLCFLDMLHNWLSNLDTPGQFLRVCFLDFSKAFDPINLNIIVIKLVDLGVQRSILFWICSFLSDA